MIHRVITALDQTATQTPDLIHGQNTVASRRISEAYDVINTSDDEVFQTDLYDWYLAQNQADRLLGIQSPFVVAYLIRRSTEDIAHADLLWRYYSQADRPHEAARVQLELAKGPFDLSLDRRIEYLSGAKANASTYMPGLGRQSIQSLLREISDLLDVANIQDDIVQRLKGDPRFDAFPEKKKETVAMLDGQIQSLSEVCYHALFWIPAD
jgi:nuclear pore complex protein Nup155